MRLAAAETCSNVVAANLANREAAPVSYVLPYQPRLRLILSPACILRPRLDRYSSSRVAEFFWEPGLLAGRVRQERHPTRTQSHTLA